jgi:predicted TIM-barrel fold metal-dependent hydrolase
VDATFAKNFPLLAEHNLSFDLQCNPSQLADAAAFLSLHPNVPVVLDHIGSLRLHRGTKAEDEAMLSTWKQGMQALAALPNVHVKLSMVGYSVDGWNKDPALEAEVVSAFRTCIALFGTNRCMVRSPRLAKSTSAQHDALLCLSGRVETCRTFWLATAANSILRLFSHV